MTSVLIRPYPWHALERVPRRALREVRSLREHPAHFVPEELSGVLTTLVGAKVEVALAGLTLGPPARRLFELGLAWDQSRVTLGVEPALASALLERILARPFALPRPDGELEPSVAGALAALAVEAARRTTSEAVALTTPAVTSPDALCARVNVHVEGRPYTAYALAALEPTPTRRLDRPSLSALGELMLAVPLVVATSLVTRGELRQLVPGSAFVPGDQAWVDATGVGRGVLIAATQERGVRVELPQAGRLVLRDETVELSPDADARDTMSEADDVNETLTDAALDAPVVVRVELGTVSMSASDWAGLRPGDVIETGRRVAEPVLLRVAGRVVARGELVDVDGEVGVRVRELFGAKPEA
jgi:type III secretion system YscQ/HrcQ family protein